MGIWGENTGKLELECGKKRKLGSTFLLTMFLLTLIKTQINEQMVLYVLSRSLLSLLPRLYNTASPPKTPIEPLAHPLPSLTSPQANPKPIPPAQLPFAVLAALSWASVMYMFRHRGERIQPGMANSMSTFFFFNF